MFVFYFFEFYLLVTLYLNVSAKKRTISGLLIIDSAFNCNSPLPKTFVGFTLWRSRNLLTTIFKPLVGVVLYCVFLFGTINIVSTLSLELYSEIVLIGKSCSMFSYTNSTLCFLFSGFTGSFSQPPNANGNATKTVPTKIFRMLFESVFFIDNSFLFDVSFCINMFYFCLQRYTHYSIRWVSDVDMWPDWTWVARESE